MHSITWFILMLRQVPIDITAHFFLEMNIASAYTRYQGGKWIIQKQYPRISKNIHEKENITKSTSSFVMLRQWKKMKTFMNGSRTRKTHSPMVSTSWKGKQSNHVRFGYVSSIFLREKGKPLDGWKIHHNLNIFIFQLIEYENSIARNCFLYVLQWMPVNVQTFL